MKENNLIEKNDIMDTQKKVYKKLIEKKEGLEYYMVYENGESHL